MNTSELERYFARTGYRGPREPTLPVLHALTRAHASSIPFENLSVLLEQRVELEFAALFDKLVDRQRGGYCFEQNGLLLRVLETLGFAVTPLSARVRLDRARDFTPPRTHMFLRVMIDGRPWLTDVGVGALSLTAALQLDPDLVQETPHETRRITREGDVYYHQVRFGSEWHDVCEFTGEAMPPIDREVANWYTSTHPGSHFANRLVAARAGTDGRRITLLNDQLKLRERDGRAHEQTIASAEQLVAVLGEHFNLRFPANTRFGKPGSAWPT